MTAPRRHRCAKVGLQHSTLEGGHIIIAVSDRIVAMHHGKVIRTFTSEEVTEESLVQAISGIVPEKAA